MNFFDGNGTSPRSANEINTLKKQVKALTEQTDALSVSLADLESTVTENKGASEQRDAALGESISVNTNDIESLEENLENYKTSQAEVTEAQVIRASEYVEAPLIRSPQLDDVSAHLENIDIEQHTQNLNIETNRLNILNADEELENTNSRLAILEEKMENEGSIPLGSADVLQAKDTLIIGETIPCSMEKIKQLLIKEYNFTDLGDNIYTDGTYIVFLKATERDLIFGRIDNISSVAQDIYVNLSGTPLYDLYCGTQIENGVYSYQDYGEEISQALIGKDTGITKYNFADDLYIYDSIHSILPSNDDVIIHTFDVTTETWKHWTYGEILALTEEEQAELEVIFNNYISITTDEFNFDSDIMSLGSFVTSENEEIDISETEGLFKATMSKKSTWGDSAVFKAYCNEYLNFFESYENVSDLPSPSFNTYAFVGDDLYIWNGSSWASIVGIYGAEGEGFYLITPIHNFSTPAIPLSRIGLVTYDGEVDGNANFNGEVNIKETLKVEGATTLKGVTTKDITMNGNLTVGSDKKIIQTPIHTYIQKTVTFLSDTDYGTFRLDKYKWNDFVMLKFSIISSTGINDTSGETDYNQSFLTEQETEEMFGDISNHFSTVFENPNMKVFIFSDTRYNLDNTSYKYTRIKMIPISNTIIGNVRNVFTEYIMFIGD